MSLGPDVPLSLGAINPIGSPISDFRYAYMHHVYLQYTKVTKLSDSTSYGMHQRNRHIFGWVIAGLLGLFVVGGLALWGFALLTGHISLLYPAPFGFFFLFPIGFLIFIFLVFFAIRVAFWGRWSGGGWRARRGYYYGDADAREILRIRYARGEISKDQLGQMMKDLDEHK
jgi:uncharacterized membrane protein